MSDSVLTVADVSFSELEELLTGYGMKLKLLSASEIIPGSY